MTTKKLDPAMVEFASTLKKIFAEVSAGKRLAHGGSPAKLADIFIGKDYKVLAQLLLPHLEVGMDKVPTPKEGFVDALKSAGLTLQEEYLPKRFFCVTKADCAHRLIFWISSGD